MSHDQSHSPRQDPVVGFATTAYRADLAGRTEQLSEHDSEWLAIANLLEHAARLPESDALGVLQQAERLAADIVNPDALDALVRRDWQSSEVHPSNAIVAVADEAHDRNAFRFAAQILDALLAANRSLPELQRGRILTRRARMAIKLGDVDGAAHRFGTILRRGRALENPELIARAWIGRAYIAHVHGNYPEIWRAARCAARIADRHGFQMLSHYAHNWLMVAAAVSGRMDDALTHGWIAYQAAADEPLKEAEVLVNVSQALLDCGHAREARAGFMAVIATEQLTAHAALPALGGIAMASAMLEDEPRVQWVAREISRLERSGAPRYAVAAALLECAFGFAMLGRSAAAAEQATGALALARTHGFHEVAFKAESLDVNSRSPAIRRVRLSARGAAVARDVERLAPVRLPAHVAFAPTGDE